MRGDIESSLRRLAEDENRHRKESASHSELKRALMSCGNVSVVG
jgi:hypothetical protein